MKGHRGLGDGCGPARTRAAPKVLALLALSSLLLSPPSAALDPSRSPGDYVRTQWRDELPSQRVLAIAQTRDGYLWLGTYDGLVRFDGVRFDLFDRTNVPEMRDSAVLHVVPDASGALWAMTGDGRLLRFRGARAEVVRERKGLSSMSAGELFVDRDGALWIGGREIGRLGRGETRIETPGRESWRSGSPVLAFAQTPDGAVWAGTESDGLRVFQDGSWTAITTAEGLVDANVRTLLADPDGSVWIGTLSGLQRLSAGRFETWGPAEGLITPRVYALGRDPEGSLWVGTDGGGLLRFREGRFEAVRPIERGGDEFVRSLLASDADGSLWVGGHGGLTRLRNGPVSAFGARAGLTNEAVRTLLEDRSGTLWIGTDGGGLFVLNGPTAVPAPGAGALSRTRIRSIGEDLAGGKWIGTQDSGLFRLDGGRLDPVPLPDSSRSRKVLALLTSRDGDLWVGTEAGVLRRRGREWSDPVPALDGIGVNTLFEARDGVVYVGTFRDGLYRLKDGGATRLTEGEGLASDKVFAVHEDAGGAVWIGTSLGLSRWDPATGKITSWQDPEALGGQQVFSILEDDAGFLWVGNNRGIHRLSRAGLDAAAKGTPGLVRLVSFGTADGMPSRQCNGANHPTAIRARDGRLFFPTSAGVAVVDPNRVGVGPKPPAVVLRRLVVDGEEVPATAGLSLGAGTRRVQVHFAPLSLLAPDRLAFRYQLTGLDDEWRETTLRQVDFTTLPPGSYRLRVQASTDRERWSERELGLDLRVATPPFRNPVSWGIGGVVLLAVAFAAFRGYVARSRALERKLHELVEQKTVALAEEKRRSDEANLRLAEANRLLETLALHDPLTGVPNRRQLDSARKAEWSRCRRLGLPLAEIAFDIDRFKDYNDALGHLAGDDCLRRVAGALTSVAGRRAGDLLARAGGDEFVALLPATGPEEALALAERACQQVAALGIRHAVSEAGSVVTVSAGVAALVLREGDTEGLTSAADAALYEAKRLGRNRAELAAAGPEGR